MLSGVAESDGSLRWVYDDNSDLILNHNNYLLFTHEFFHDSIKQSRRAKRTHAGYFQGKMDELVKTLHITRSHTPMCDLERDRW